MATSSAAEHEILTTVEIFNGNSNQLTAYDIEMPQDSNSSSSTSVLQRRGFSCVRKIGTGSYSKVMLAYSKTHQMMVAIKTVSKFKVPEEFLRKFLYNEVKVIKFLKHENIITYLQSIETSHRVHVIMQHAENGSILDLIHKLKRLSETRACYLFRQILSAVEYIHGNSIAHRDLKCENILLDHNFNVKIIDFGFARSFKSQPKQLCEDNLLTAVGGRLNFFKKSKDTNLSETYCGSYAYASPEILQGIPYDPFLSDMWAIGVVLYAMVFGHLPFDDREPKRLMKQVLAPLSFPVKVSASVELKVCIKKMLAPVNVRYNVERLKDDYWISTAAVGYNPRENTSRNVYTR